MAIYHGCPSPKKLQHARDAAPSFTHGAEWNPDKMTAHDWPYIIDNGAYQAWQNDEEWDADPFLKRLEQIETRMPRDPDFVVLPDILKGSFESMARSAYWARRVDEFGVDYYLPVQNGMPVEQAVRAAVDIGASGIFVGGSRAYKEEYAGQYVMTAHDCGLKCHIGKPGPRLTWARDLGADSVDTVSIVRNRYWGRLRKLEGAEPTDETTLADGGWS